jgi:hypothetical protein
MDQFSSSKKGKNTAVPVTANKYAEHVAATFSHLPSDQLEPLMQLATALYEVNGQDAYSNEAMSLGKLRVEEYLAIPNNAVLPDVHPADVGGPDVRDHFRPEFLAQVYALNKLRAPPGSDPVKYATVRLEAVKMGWFAGQKEVIQVAPLASAIGTFIADKAVIAPIIEDARTIAFLVPLFAEHVFRTSGHHYISAMAGEYDTKYLQLFKSSLMPQLFAFLPPSTMFHHMLHWVSPRRAFEVLRALIDSDRLPDAVRIRATAAPAGTAIITTTAAVASAMIGAGVWDELKAHASDPLEEILTINSRIRQTPVRYHRTTQAYSAVPLTPTERDDLESARQVATRFAPIAQGFIDALFKNAPLGKAKALVKHADENPMLRKKASKYFKSLAKHEVVSAKDLFAHAAPAAVI